MDKNMARDDLKVAIVIPCYNEAVAIGGVVHDFRQTLPRSDIYVFDNNSNDGTAAIAEAAGAIVRFVANPGKGNVVRRMFADVEADVYVMVDGDATYDAASAPELVRKLVDENLDMVVGCRSEESHDNDNYRPGHRLGNKLLTGSVQRMFGGQFTDMLSGYRAFSRRFAKTFPAASKGFEVETEITVHTLEMRMPHGEIMTPYTERPEGSESKLSTYRDGIRIARMIASLYTNERPRDFWWGVGVILLLLSIVFFIPIIEQFLSEGVVTRFPTLIVIVGFSVAAFVSFTIGIVLHAAARGRRESKHTAYLAVKSTNGDTAAR